MRAPCAILSVIACERSIFYNLKYCAIVHLDIRNCNHFDFDLNRSYTADDSLRFDAFRLQRQNRHIHSRLLRDGPVLPTEPAMPHVRLFPSEREHRRWVQGTLRHSAGYSNPFPNLEHGSVQPIQPHELRQRILQLGTAGSRPSFGPGLGCASAWRICVHVPLRAVHRRLHPSECTSLWPRNSNLNIRIHNDEHHPNTQHSDSCVNVTRNNCAYRLFRVNCRCGHPNTRSSDRCHP